MTTAHQTEEMIPVTDRHWRERWAAELTRANALERELHQARAARDAARQTVDDLTAHCEGQGNRIASLERSVSTLDEVVAAWRAKSQQNFARADKLAAWIEEEARERGYTTDDLSDLIREAGVECESCGGSRIVYEPGYHSDADSSADYSETCESCDGIGKVLR